MTHIPANQLDPAAVFEANQQLWKNHPELHGRQLTLGSEDTTYRKEWMNLYSEAKAQAFCPAPPAVEPVPVDTTPLPVLVGAPPPCPGVTSMTHEEKMERAISSAHLDP